MPGKVRFIHHSGNDCNTAVNYETLLLLNRLHRQLREVSPHLTSSCLQRANSNTVHDFKDCTLNLEIYPSEALVLRLLSC